MPNLTETFPLWPTPELAGVMIVDRSAEFISECAPTDLEAGSVVVSHDGEGETSEEVIGSQLGQDKLFIEGHAKK